MEQFRAVLAAVSRHRAQQAWTHPPQSQGYSGSSGLLLSSSKPQLDLLPPALINPLKQQHFRAPQIQLVMSRFCLRPPWRSLAVDGRLKASTAAVVVVASIVRRRWCCAIRWEVSNFHNSQKEWKSQLVRMTGRGDSFLWPIYLRLILFLSVSYSLNLNLHQTWGGHYQSAHCFLLWHCTQIVRGYGS